MVTSVRCCEGISVAVLFDAFVPEVREYNTLRSRVVLTRIANRNMCSLSLLPTRLPNCS